VAALGCHRRRHIVTDSVSSREDYISIIHRDQTCTGCVCVCVCVCVHACYIA